MGLRRVLSNFTTRAIPEIASERDAADLGEAATSLQQEPAANRQVTAKRRAEIVRIAHGSISAADLAKRKLSAPLMIVESMLPVGAAILAGLPKSSKTTLAFQLGYAIASGRDALGELATSPGGVIFLALEDTLYRLQTRLARLLGDEAAGLEWPGRLHMWTEWPRLDAGGFDVLEETLALHQDTQLVVIDTLARILPSGSRRATQYNADYAVMAALKTIADHHGICILVLHHTRKAAARDPLATVSGTLGLTGAVDTVLVLRRERGQDKGSLFITGRDLEERDLALAWDSTRGSWSLLGDAEDPRLGEARADIRQVLTAASGPMKPHEIAAALGKRQEAVRYLLWVMKRDGQVVSRASGYVNPPLPITVHIADADASRTVSGDPGERTRD